MKKVFTALLVALFAETLVAATFTVTSNNDSGAGTLRDAVVQANASAGADTINFTVTGTIVLTTGQMVIDGPLTIVGPGANTLTIDGNANSRIFSIFVTDPACPALDGPDYLVTISGLRFTNARRLTSNSGGAIFSEHSLALDSVIVDNSVAGFGGGVAVHIQYPGQSLSITNSQFLNNAAQPLAGPVNAFGGAVSIFERCAGTRTTPVPVTIANTVFFDNRAQPVTLDGFGGAIAIDSSADVVISDTRIVGNAVVAPNPPVINQIYRGGGIHARAKSLIVERSEIANNAVTDVPSGGARGGGLQFLNLEFDLQAPIDAMAAMIVNSTISGNTSSATAGAMSVIGNVALDLENSTVSDNSASSTRTGGIVFTTGPTVPPTAGNAAAPTLTVVSSILANNTSDGGDVATNVGVIPSFTINATNSLIEKICPPPTCQINVAGTGNLIAVDPVLGPLGFNGGSTRTQPVVPGSPTINAGSNPLGLTTDQRGGAFARVVGGVADMGAFESGNPPAANGFAPGSTLVTSALNAAPTGVTSLAAVCPASGILVVTGSGESAAKSNFAGNAFIGLAYSIARDSSATDNGNVVQSSALAVFNGDANREFLNVQRVDLCTPGQTNTYFLTVYATTPQTSISNGSFVWNGRLTAISGPADSGIAAGSTFVSSATNATPTIVTTLPVICPASGTLTVTGSGESAAKSNFAGNAFIGLAYSIARDSIATDNGNVVQSSAFAVFAGDANRDFLNVQRVDSCTPGLSNTYRLTVYATTPQTGVTSQSFVWNGRLTATTLPVATGFAPATSFIGSATNAAPTVVTSVNIVCPASGTAVVTGSGESAAKSNFAGNAFIGLAYSIARDSTATDNSNVVQSSALAKFNGDANRDFLNVQRADTCTPGQPHTYFLTAYATTPQTSIVNDSFVWNGRLVAILPP